MARSGGQGARNLGKRLLNAVPRARSAWRKLQHFRVVAAQPTVAEGVQALEARWPSSDASDEEPIFLLASGWRSGSTLVQRLIMSSGNALMWGEPYHRCSPVQRFAACVRAFTPDWPPQGAILTDGDGGIPRNTYLANLFPEAADFKDAHRAFFDRLFAVPARRRGFDRWGVKEVRLTADHACYLAWLYRRARFVFLIRDPYRAYRSYRMFRPWYAEWPDEPVLTATDFGALWRECAGGFTARAEEVGAHVVRYEDLTADSSPVVPLSEYLGIPLDPGILEQRKLDRPWKLQEIPAAEVVELQAAIDPLASRLGYSPPR